MMTALLPPSDLQDLEQHEATIQKGLSHFYAVGLALEQIRSRKLYRSTHATFAAYLNDRWEIKRSVAYRYITEAKVVNELVSPDGDIQAPTREAQVRPLVSKEPDVRRKAWATAVAEAGDAKKVTGPMIESAIVKVEAQISAAEPNGTSGPSAPEQHWVDAQEAFGAFVTAKAGSDTTDMLITVPSELIGPALQSHAREVGNKTTDYDRAVPSSLFGTRPPIDEILDAYRSTGRRFTLNKTNEHVDWAKYSWNPVTGCRHTCPYCYARHIADLRYAQKFEPTFHTGRLLAPSHAPAPTSDAHVRDRNVFTCSMADLYGKWVPDWAIEAVHKAAEQATEWRFLMLTKFPQKLDGFSFPKNAWIGATVDEQSRVSIVEKHMAKINASVKWLSCEPMLERLTFTDIGQFDCVVIGAQKGYGMSIKDKQPELEWVVHLMQQALSAGVKVYWKDNLELPKQLPMLGGGPKARFAPLLVGPQQDDAAAQAPLIPLGTQSPIAAVAANAG